MPPAPTMRSLQPKRHLQCNEHKWGYSTVSGTCSPCKMSRNDSPTTALTSSGKEVVPAPLASPVIFMTEFEHSRGREEMRTVLFPGKHFMIIPQFKIIQTAYLFLPAYASSQAFGLLYNFPHHPEDTRLLFQYSFSGPVFHIHCTDASNHSAQGP